MLQTDESIDVMALLARIGGHVIEMVQPYVHVLVVTVGHTVVCITYLNCYFYFLNQILNSTK